MTREHKFLGGNQENQCVKEFRCDNTPPVREKGRVDTRDKRRETTRDCTEYELRTRLASASVASSGRNECSGTHCNLIVQEKKDSSCQIC